MTTHNTLMTRLRHLGHSDPDDTSWRAICSLLTHFEQTTRTDLQTALDYTARLLEPWPDALRVAPPYWMKRLLRGERPAAWPLIRALELNTASPPLLTLLTEHGGHITRLSLVGGGGHDAWRPVTRDHPRWGALWEALRTHLEALTLNHVDLDNEDALALFAGPWPRLRRLELWHLHRLGVQTARRLTDETLPALRELSFKGSHPLQATTLEELARRGHRTLHTLEVPDIPLSSEQTLALAAAPSLELSAVLTEPLRLQDAALTWVLQRPHPDRDGVKLGTTAEEVARQLDHVAPRHPERLALADRCDPSCAALLAEADLGGLLAFSLGSQIWPDAALERLLAAPWVQRLQELSLRSAPINMGRVEMLLRHLDPDGPLRRLNLERCGLSADGAARLVEHLPLLERIDLSDNLDVAGVNLGRVLERCPPTLRVGSSFHAQRTPEARALYLSHPATALQFVSGHTLTTTGDPQQDVTLMRTVGDLPIRRVRLRHATRTSIEALNAAPGWRGSLRQLSLHMRPTPQALAALGEGPLLPRLSRLELAGFHLAEAEARVMRDWPRGPQVLTLSLSPQPGFLSAMQTLSEAPWSAGLTLDAITTYRVQTDATLAALAEMGFGEIALR